MVDEESDRLACPCFKRNREGRDEQRSLICDNKGLTDVSYCTGDGLLPFAISTVHFLDADPSLKDDIRGIKPDRSKHDTFLDIEPVRIKIYSLESVRYFSFSDDHLSTSII